MIIEENLEGWNNIPVKSKEVIYPQSKDDKAPKNYFLGIFDMGTAPAHLQGQPQHAVVELVDEHALVTLGGVDADLEVFGGGHGVLLS